MIRISDRDDTFANTIEKITNQHPTENGTEIIDQISNYHKSVLYEWINIGMLMGNNVLYRNIIWVEWICLVLDVFNDYVFKLGEYDEILFHASVTYISETFLKPTTGKTDEEIGVDIILSNLPTRYDDLNDNLIKAIKPWIMTDESKKTLTKIFYFRSSETRTL